MSASRASVRIVGALVALLLLCLFAVYWMPVQQLRTDDGAARASAPGADALPGREQAQLEQAGATQEVNTRTKRPDTVLAARASSSEEAPREVPLDTPGATIVRVQLADDDDRPLQLEGVQIELQPRSAGAVHSLQGFVGLTDRTWRALDDEQDWYAGLSWLVESEPMGALNLNIVHNRREADPASARAATAQSTVGLAYTDRIENGAFNRVVGGDVRLVFAKLYYVEVQGANSWTRGDSLTVAAPLWQATVSS